jgi:sialate O-acetylesterase
MLIILFNISFVYYLVVIYSATDVTMQSYDPPRVAVPLNHSNLFNAMIYPFTRMVVYGSIWYQGNNDFFIYFTNFLDFTHAGEANAGGFTYACSFAKMIQYWRQIWNERTNGITDIQFPFGFVQVSFTRAH